VDNEGAFTVVDWVSRLIDEYSGTEDRPFDRVLIVRVQPFPAANADPRTGRVGWAYELFGPLTALQHVREASQAERNEFAFKTLNARYAPLHALRAQAEAIPPMLRQGLDALTGTPALRGARQRLQRWFEQEEKLEVPIESVAFTFQPFKDGKPDKEYVTPLSWRLTNRQKRQIEDAWQDLRGGGRKTGADPLAVMDRYFDPQPRP
jgi:hypothetical protein